jgi:YD repeat-containing protein
MIRRSRRGSPRSGAAEFSGAAGAGIRSVVKISRRLLDLAPVRRLRAGDPLGLGRGARSPGSQALQPRTGKADRVIRTREQTWQDRDEQGRRVSRTLGMASLGGATLDNEENYLIKKLFTALGAIQIENHKRTFAYRLTEVAAA